MSSQVNFLGRKEKKVSGWSRSTFPTPNLTDAVIVSIVLPRHERECDEKKQLNDNEANQER